MQIQSLGIIGAGTMGIGIAIDAVLHHIDVIIVDVKAAILDHAEKEILKGVRFAPLLKPCIKAVSPNEVRAKVCLTTDMNAIANCDFIIENVTEDWEIKQNVYKQLDEICKEEVCFAVNTSCLSITQIAGITKRPDQVVGIHFMNPVFLKPVTEMIKGYCTSEQTIEIAVEILKLMDKEAIIVNDYPGFVSNRISHLFMNEAAFVLQDGVATAQQIDNIFKLCFNHKMGPLETADLIGLDTVVDSLNILYNSYQDSKYRCCPFLKKMVHAGELGKKTGKGFYNYKI